MEFIKSPLNYTGNKYRILKQIVPFFPKKINFAKYEAVFCSMLMTVKE